MSNKEQILLDSKAVQMLTETVGGGSTVIANPELVGDEPDLEGLEVDGTKYKVPQGTTVVANPTLAGTEANLTGLQVGDTKYAIPQGGGIEYVDLENTTGTLTNETILKARNGEVLFRYEHNVFLHSNFIVGSGDVYSTVMDENSHYLKMVINTRSYQYEIETVSGGSAQHYHKVVLLAESTEQYCFAQEILLDVYIDTPESLTVADIWNYINGNSPILIQTDNGVFGTIYFDNCAATDPLFNEGGIEVTDFVAQYGEQQLFSTQVTIAYDQYI